MTQPVSISHICPTCGASKKLLSDKLNAWACVCREIPFVEADEVKATFLTKLERNLGKLQPGTTGVWKNQSFTLTGVIRVWFNEAVINYWTVLFQDDTIWYLEEGYGFHAFLKPDKSVTPYTADQLKKIRTESKPVLKGDQPYILINKNEFWKAEVEGSIHLPAVLKDMRMYDFAADDGTKVSIIQWEPGTIQAYEVEYVKREELKFASGKTIKRSAELNPPINPTISSIRTNH